MESKGGRTSGSGRQTLRHRDVEGHGFSRANLDSRATGFSRSGATPEVRPAPHQVP